MDDPAADEIFSYGHRNAQGMAVHPETGEIWQSEHGKDARRRDQGAGGRGNFGWPIATYACEYGTDNPIGEHPSEGDGTVPPIYYRQCGETGFPPAGMTFYDGDEFPQWQGDLLFGGLARGVSGAVHGRRSPAHGGGAAAGRRRLADPQRRGRPA